MPVPVIRNAAGAIVRITTAAICGSDLHFYHQDIGSSGNPMPISHGAVGYIEAVGYAVQSLQVGDYVIVPDNLNDGHFNNGPELLHSFSGPENGGLQAEYARVSFADNSLIPLSVNASTNASTIIDYLFVSEIFATGWTVLDFAGFKPGDTVAVFDAGPVGLLAAYSAVLRGASKVYFIDHVQARLDLAKSIGAIPINFNETDPVERVLVLEPNGVTPSVDCAWYEAVNAQGESELGVVLRSMMNFTSDYGGVGVVGVYLGDETTTMSMTQFWRKALTMGSGIVLPLQHATLVTRDPANDSSNLRWTSCPYSGLSLGSQLECCNRVINTDCCSYRTSSSTPPPPYPPVAAAACALFLPGYFQNLSSSPI